MARPSSPFGWAVASRAPLRRITRLFLGAWLGFLALAGDHLGAAAATITAVLDREAIGLGDSATLRVSLSGAGGNETPRLPEVPGLRIQQTSSQRQFSFVNGVQSSSLELQYTLTPSRIGTFTIGPITLGAARVTGAAGPFQLRALAANDPAVARQDGSDQAAFLVLQLPRPEVFVGEAFVAEAHLHAIGGNLRQAPQFQGDGFTLGRLTNAPLETNIRTNNRVYGRIRFLQPMTAARSGDLSLLAAGCILDIPTSRRQPGREFGDIFEELFSGREARRYNLQTDPVVLRVLPLPKAGQPPGFNGAVGDFQVALTATPTNVQAGDPITVRIEIRGRGNFDALQLPAQPAWKGFRSYPPNSTNEPSDFSGFVGVKRFEQVLAPESADLTELPAFELSFFEPDSRTYRTLRTRPVPLRVSPGATTPSLPLLGQVAGSTPASNQPQLPPLKPHLGLPVAVAAPWITQPWFLGIAALPPLAWLGALAWRQRQDHRSRESAARHREQLWRRVDEGLRALAAPARVGDAETFHATLFRILQDALAARLGQPPASITEGVLDTALAQSNLPPETVTTLHRLFQACNQARYARQGSPGDLAALADETGTVTRELKSRA